jgi:hypothetical protein
MTSPALRLVLQQIHANAAEGERLAQELDRQRDVAQLLVAAVEVLDRKVERILRKLERRDG